MKYGSSITANATMDISAARDGLNMAIVIERKLALDGYEKNIARWEWLKSKLPSYKYDDTGALCEWAMKEYTENNEHRHISHLYCAWPAYEAHADQALTAACKVRFGVLWRERVPGFLSYVGISRKGLHQFLLCHLKNSTYHLRFIDAAGSCTLAMVVKWKMVPRSPLSGIRNEPLLSCRRVLTGEYNNPFALVSILGYIICRDFPAYGQVL